MKEVNLMGKEALQNECRKRKMRNWSKLGLENLKKLLKKEMSSQMKIGIMRRKMEKKKQKRKERRSRSRTAYA